MSYAGGQWVLLILGSAFVLLAVILFIAAIRGDSEWAWGGFLLLVISILLFYGGFTSAEHRYDSQTVRSDLTGQGFTVVSVDLDGKQVTVKSPDGCLFTRKLVHIDGQGYQLVLDDRVVKPSELTCNR